MLLIFDPNTTPLQSQDLKFVVIELDFFLFYERIFFKLMLVKISPVTEFKPGLS